jgi:glycosyltransferase involved in cell wall biosynthesis
MSARLSWADYPPPAELPPVALADPALPLISVVTPSFNQGPFIERTIASVLGQDYPNLEYWVVDGGSSDETLAVLRRYEGDPRFHWLSAPDRGQSDAVNKGWRRCRGELLGWLNSDDTYLPGALRRLAGCLAQHPTADVAYGDVGLLRRSYINQPGALQRRGAVERFGPLSLVRHFALDYEFYLRVALEGQIVYLGELCATYRIHTSSKTVTGAGRFTRELYEVAAQALARADLPAAIAQRRAAIHGEWYARMAASYAQDGAYREALRGMLMALRHDPLQLKAYAVPLMILDIASGMQLSARRFNIRHWPRTGQSLEAYLREHAPALSAGSIRSSGS